MLLLLLIRLWLLLRFPVLGLLALLLLVLHLLENWMLELVLLPMA